MTIQLASTRFGISERAYKSVDLNHLEEIGVGVRADEWVFYAAQVRPFYDQINGIVGQLAGLLILGQAKSCFEAYYSLASTPQDQIEECRSGLAQIRPPLTAVVHHNHLSKASAQVEEIARTLRRSVSNPDQLRVAIPQMVKSLESVCSMLRCAADPVVRLQTIDFADGCACCTPRKNQEFSITEQSLIQAK
ncbi:MULTISPECIES: hypothetical protein [Pseudomonas]|uniref:Uncharacterized protein n=1 Tax=Pseudomonas putida TaxID=303 RepID=A0A7V8EBC8_PSEPU|nr:MULTISPECIES: hypothetical protein [Pseudomonas]KAF0251002.1 hypothetical protein GN299_30880 [Pseudomonas putida]MBL7228290.1 hypothetical protein [Pseudomonas sp.]